MANKAFQTDKVAVSHLLQRAQKMRHNNFAAEQRRYEASQVQCYIHAFVKNSDNHNCGVVAKVIIDKMAAL